jgi:hypothetical protein
MAQDPTCHGCQNKFKNNPKHFKFEASSSAAGTSESSLAENSLEKSKGCHNKLETNGLKEDTGPGRNPHCDRIRSIQHCDKNSHNSRDPTRILQGSQRSTQSLYQRWIQALRGPKESKKNPNDAKGSQTIERIERIDPKPSKKALTQ